MTSILTISKFAKAGGVNIQTIRYYERRKLLRPKTKRPSGYRLYDAEALRQLHFIKNAQDLGFTLREIGELLNLRVTSVSQCREVQRKAQVKLVQAKIKLKEMRALTQALQRLIQTCKAGKPTDQCPLVKTLEIPPRRRRLRKSVTRS